ncbi:hypothetical protein F511_02113 [Dorcoceras hygrometricum]|nr:hypothetical protein F511_02113 [Dorcoceras hygrometricum]
MSGRGRGRRSFTKADSESDGMNPVLNTMAQLLERLVNQNNNGNGKTSGRIVSREDPQERFRRQRPQEFSGTTDPLIAESWIKSIEVIFDYLQLTEQERPRCAIYMLRGDAMIWWEGAKLTVDVGPKIGSTAALLKDFRKFCALLLHFRTRYSADLFLEVRISMSYISPSSTSEGSTRRFDLTTRVQTQSHNQQL